MSSGVLRELCIQDRTHNLNHVKITPFGHSGKTSAGLKIDINFFTVIDHTIHHEARRSSGHRFLGTDHRVVSRYTNKNFFLVKICKG